MKHTRNPASFGALALAAALSTTQVLAYSIDDGTTNTISSSTNYNKEVYVGINNPDNGLIIDSDVSLEIYRLIVGDSESASNNLVSVEGGARLIVGDSSTNGLATGGIVVGDTIDDATIKVDYNSTLEGEFLYVGVETNDTGKITVDGEGSELNIAQDAYVGLAGDDSVVSIGAGAAMQVGGDLTVGDTGSNNTVNISGTLFVNSTNNINVNSDAGNEVTVKSGGKLQVGGDVETATLADLGVDMISGSTLELGGNLDLSYNRVDNQYHVMLNNELSTNNTATWNTDAVIAIGKTTRGNSLTLTNGATGTAADIVRVGESDAADDNTLSVGGAGSEFTVEKDLTIGHYGANNELNIGEDGLVDAQATLFIGKNSSATGNKVNIASNGTLNVTSAVYIGDNGANSELTVTDGSVTANEIILGNNSTGNRLTASGSNAQVNVAGDFTIGSQNDSSAATIRGKTDTDGSMASIHDGAVLDIQQDLTVGKDGSGSILAIRDEAVVNVAGNAVIGENSGDNYIFLEPGSNAQLTVTGNLTVGSDGDAGDNRFAVYGGTANIGGDLLVGANTNQHTLKNYIHLETTNAVLNVANAVHIGATSSDNTVDLKGGATLNTKDLFVGTYNGASNNIVTVSGLDSNTGEFVTNSVLKVSDSLVIGAASNSANNSVVLQDGGILEVAQANITIGSTNNTLRVADGGILKTLGWDFDDQAGLATNIVFEEGATLHSLGVISGTNMVEGGIGFTFDGPSASWTDATNTLYVGNTTDGNSLTITNGATIATSTNLHLGFASKGNSITIGGAGSALDIGADLHLGNATNTTPGSNTQNILAVLDGASLTVGNDAFLHNYGALNIDSKSQAQISGDYNQDSTSTLEIGISSNQVSPNLVVGGNAEFGKTEDSDKNPIILIYSEGVAESNEITIVQAGSITVDGETASSGTIAGNIHTNKLLGFNVTLTNDAINNLAYIVLNDFRENTLGEAYGLEGQLLDVANEIDLLADDGNTNATEMLKTLAGMSSGEAEALDNLYGEKQSSVPANNVINKGVQFVSEQLTLRADNTRARMVSAEPAGAAGPHQPEQELQGWISAFGTWSDKKASDGYEGYEADIGGFMVGADFSVAPNVLMGIAGGRAGSTINKSAGVSTDTKSIYAALYGSVGTKDWFGDASLIYANSSIDSTLDPTFDTQAEYDAQNVAFMVGGGKEIIGKYMVFTPYASFLGNIYSQEDYKETASNAVGRDVDSFSNFNLQSSLGGSAAMYMGLGSVTLKPEVRIHWLHEWLGDEEKIDYQLIGGTGSYTMQLQAPEKDIIKLGIGSSAKFGEYLELRADLDTRFGKDYSDYTLLGSLRYQF